MIFNSTALFCIYSVAFYYIHVPDIYSATIKWMQENRKRDFVWVQKTVPKDAYAPLKGFLNPLFSLQILTNFEI